MAWWLMPFGRWTGPRPINAYVIEHRDGLERFDTGQDRASVTASRHFPRRPARDLYGRLANFEIKPQTLSASAHRFGGVAPHAI